MRTRINILMAALALGILSQTAHGAAILTEDFETDLGDWIGNTVGTSVVRVANGGNPDGYLQSTAGSTFPGIIGAQNVTSPYSGSYVAAGIDTVMVDLNFFSGTFTDAVLRFRSSAADNGWAISLTNQFLNSWQSFTVVFDPTWTNVEAQANGWVQSLPEVAFTNLWTGVFNAEVRLTGSSATTLVAGIDNFAFKSSSVPEPATITLLTLGLLGAGYARRRRTH